MRQEERVTESRNMILEAAILEFGSKSYNEASTNEICLACGISKGLVFYHFKSKEQLFKECAAYCIEQFDTYMKDHYVEIKEPMDGIRRCCLLRKEFFASHPHYHHIFCQVFYERDDSNKGRNINLLKMYKQHSYEMLSKILSEVEMNPRIDREECIRGAVLIIEVIDREIFGSTDTSQQTEQMLEKQMKKYENFLEMLLYGILRQ